MKVSRKSWHYRLHRFIGSVWKYGWDALPIPDSPNSRRDFNPGSLCTYFWSTLGLVLSSPLLVIAAILLCIVLAVCYAAYWGIYKPWMKLVRDPYKRRRSAHFAAKALENAKKPPKEPSLLAEFVKAKKSRVCPVITLVD